MTAATVKMYDSVTIANIPADAEFIAAYVDGRYANYDQALSTGATVVSISVKGAPADVGDVEAGCLWPNARGVLWAQEQLDGGARPTLYTFRANWAALSEELELAGTHAGEVDWWVAEWDGVATVPPGAVAKQFYSDDRIDISVALASWPALGLAPALPASAPGGNVFIREKNGAVYWFVANGPQSYWRLVPAGLVGNIPPGWVMDDPNGSWLALWQTKPAA